MIWLQWTHFPPGRLQCACVIRTWRGGVSCGQVLKLLPVHTVSIAEETLLLLMISFNCPARAGTALLPFVKIQELTPFTRERSDGLLNRAGFCRKSLTEAEFYCLIEMENVSPSHSTHAG